MIPEDDFTLPEVKDSLEEVLAEIEGEEGNGEGAGVPVRPRPQAPRSGEAAAEIPSTNVQ